MRKELREVTAKLAALVEAYRAAFAEAPKLRADADAALDRRNELLHSPDVDPYSDSDALALTILSNRAELLRLKAERVDGSIPVLLQTANDYAQTAHAALCDVLEADAKAIQAKIAVKLAKAGDLSEDEAEAASLSVEAVREAWGRVHEGRATDRSDAAAVLEALQTA